MQSPLEEPMPSVHDDTTSRVHVRHHGPLTPRGRGGVVDQSNIETPSPRSRPSSFPTIRKSKPQRIRVFVYNRCRRLRHVKTRTWIMIGLTIGIIIPMIASFLFWLFHHLQCYQREHGVEWYEAPVHQMERTCPAPDYDILPTTTDVSICITTLTDRQSPSWYQRLIRCRDFDALATISFPNQQSYASKHNYYWKDASALIDTSRPPAWSKIRAVQQLFESDKHHCDWVLWLDADVVIMNSNIQIQSLLPANPETMLVATFDRKFTLNSGVWLLRNHPWSHKFLSDWWNLKNWVRRPGMSLSGDNAAFGHLVDQVLQQEPSRIRTPRRCNMNSFGVFLTKSELDRFQDDEAVLASQEWYMSDKFYHKGDFIVHASGLDKKKEALEMMVMRAT